MEISALTACPLHVDESVTAPPTTSVVSNPLRIETSTHNGVQYTALVRQHVLYQQ